LNDVREAILDIFGAETGIDSIGKEMELFMGQFVIFQ
jgi:hypothetical protein